MNVNKIILAGRITRDIETRHTQGGMVIASFGLAVNRKRKGEEETMFVDCTAFDKQGELIAQHLGKGDPIFIEGRLQLERWDSKDGQKRSKHAVVVENFQFMGKDKDGERKPAAPKESYGDVPF